LRPTKICGRQQIKYGVLNFSMVESWQDKIKNAPRVPGVYLMKDAGDKVIYVGKAKDLGSRTRAYLNGTDKRFMIPFLTSRITGLEFILTGTEKEALILENNLIKEHRPKYNVNLRDDKTYYSIRIDLQQPFPRFQLVRQVKKDGAQYFGPYPSSAAAKETLYFLQSIFTLRTCSDRQLINHHERPCLEYQIKRCLAPCTGRAGRATYGRMVRDSIAFLEGKEKGLLRNLAARMNAAAELLNYEEAAILRDKIAALETTIEKQRIFSTQFKDQDVFGLYREGDLTQVFVFHIRKGKLLGRKAFPHFVLKAPSEEILSSLLTQYYDGNSDIPAEILLPCRLEDGAVIAEWLTDKRCKKVALLAPQRGQGRDLLLMAAGNAESTLKAERQGLENTEAALVQLAEKLGLKNIPRRIECFDISNISGKYAVGSQVTFVNGRPFKDGYRRYRIRTISGMDDFGMLREVLGRRYQDKQELPDLAVVDGGKGQLNAAAALFRDLGIDGVDLIGFAKEKPADRPSAVNKAEDRVYLLHRKDPLYTSRWPQAHFLLQQVRDEAHRFALAYHHKLKEKRDFHSLLDDIPGIGATRKKDLLVRFGGIKQVTAASLEELQQVRGISKELATGIRNYLRERSSTNRG